MFDSKLLINSVNTIIKKHSLSVHFQPVFSMLGSLVNNLQPNSTITLLDAMTIINNAYYQALSIHKSQGLLHKLGLISCSFIVDLLENSIKTFLGNNDLRIGSKDPIDTCYSIAKYFVDNKKIDDAKEWLNCAVCLGGGGKISNFLEKVNPSLIKELALANEEIALFVIRKSQAAQLYISIYSLDFAELEYILHNVLWTKKTAAKATRLLLSTKSPLIGSISSLQSLRQVSEANFVLFDHPALITLYGIRKPRRYYEIPCMNAMSDANPIDTDIMTNILISAIPALLEHIEYQIYESDKIHNFISYARKYALFNTEHMKIVIQKCEEKAKEGYIDFERICGDWYYCNNDLDKACPFLLKAALKNDDYSVQLIQNIGLENNADVVNYSLGMFHLHNLEYEKAKECFEQVSDANSAQFDETQYQLANMQFCLEKNKHEALTTFAKIKSVHLLGECSPVIGACRSNEPQPSITDIYAVQSKKKRGDESTELNMENKHQLFGCSSDKKISNEKFNMLWQTYNDYKSKKKFKKTSASTMLLYNMANSGLYNEVGIYKLVKEFMLDQKNKKRDFYKIIGEGFEKNFFDDLKSQKVTK